MFEARHQSVDLTDFRGETEAPSLARVRAELDAIRKSLEALERELSRFDEPSPRAPSRTRSERYYQLLLEVFEQGPHGVSAEQLDELASRCGYDRRGLNGYFAGVRAPLQRDGTRIQLTLEGRRLVNERLHDEATG